jgi:hypothetical protein
MSPARLVLLTLTAGLLALGCTRPTTRFNSQACAVDDECELVNPCCACCQELPMTKVDAQTERDRCTTVECRTECASDQCVPTNHRAACRDGQCVAVPN